MLIDDINEHMKLIRTFYYAHNDKLNQLPSVKNIKHAIMKLILRKLPMYVEQNEHKYNHIVNNSLWSEENCGKHSETEFLFPQKFEFKKIYEMHKLL